MTTDEYGKAYQRGFDCTVRFLLSRGVRRDEATESAQAAWVRGWERLKQLRDEKTVLPWVNTIALNFYRGLIRREVTTMPLTEFRGATAIDLAAIDVAHILEFCRPSDRDLLEQQLLGVTTKEIADRQGVTETAIRLRFLRARRTVRSQVKTKIMWRTDARFETEKVETEAVENAA
jgi:DNA-directed RNA polymerase specialized sigma24 family protein